MTAPRHDDEERVQVAGKVCNIGNGYSWGQVENDEVERGLQVLHNRQRSLAREKFSWVTDCFASGEHLEVLDADLLDAFVPSSAPSEDFREAGVAIHLE